MRQTVVFPLAALLMGLSPTDLAQALEKSPTASGGTPTEARAAPRESVPQKREGEGLPFDGRAFSLETHVAWGVPTAKTYGLKINPYGLGLGGRISWMTRSGFWIGLGSTYHFGRTISQTYEPPDSSNKVSVDAQTQAIAIGPQVGFDMLLSPVVLRYSLDIGATYFSWDFGDIPYSSLAGFTPTQGSAWGQCERIIADFLVKSRAVGHHITTR